MVWRASARRGGNFRNVNFNVFGNSAKLVSKLEFHADIAVFVNLDVVYKINEDFPVERFNVLMFLKGHQRRMLAVNAVCQFRPFSSQPLQHIGDRAYLPFIVSLHCPVVLLGNFPVFPVLIKRLFVAGNFRQFLFLCDNQIIQSKRLAFFDWSRVDTGKYLRKGNGQMYLLTDGKQDGGLQPLMLD